MPKDDQELLDARELAPLLGVAQRTVWRWRSARRITPFPTLGGKAKYSPRAVAAEYTAKGMPVPPRLAAYLAERYPDAPSSPTAQPADVHGAA